MWAELIQQKFMKTHSVGLMSVKTHEQDYNIGKLIQSSILELSGPLAGKIIQNNILSRK